VAAAFFFAGQGALGAVSGARGAGDAAASTGLDAERANGTHGGGGATEGRTSKREGRCLWNGGNAPSPLHLLPSFCGDSI
jgi:hypothetical protein